MGLGDFMQALNETMRINKELKEYNLWFKSLSYEQKKQIYLKNQTKPSPISQDTVSQPNKSNEVFRI